MIRNNWKINARKIVPLVVLILMIVASSEQIRTQAQTHPSTTVKSTTPTPQAPAGTGHRPGVTTASVCLAPRSAECLEMRINELTNQTAALERDVNAIRNLLQSVDTELQKHGDGKGDLAGTIASIWKAITDLQQKTKNLN